MLSSPLEVEGRPELASAFPRTLDPLENRSFLYGILSINLLQYLMNFGAFLAQFHKRLEVNPFFKLLFDLHFDNARKRVPQRIIARSPAFSYSGLAPTERQLGSVE
jgi:hypothetical protein